MDPNTQQTQPQAAQTTTTNPPAATTPPPAAPAAGDTAGAELAQMRATIAAQEAAIASLKDESARRRQETKAERDAKESQARAAGDLTAVVKSLEEKLAEKDAALSSLDAKIKDYEPDAVAQRQWRETAKRKLDDVAKALPADQREIFDALPSVEARKKFLAVVAKPAPAAPPATPPAAPPPNPGGVPAAPNASAAPTNIETMSLADLQALERSNPTEWAKAIGVGGPVNQTADPRSRMGF